VEFAPKRLRGERGRRSRDYTVRRFGQNGGQRIRAGVCDGQRCAFSYNAPRRASAERREDRAEFAGRYTFSKSIDDTSAVLGGGITGSGGGGSADVRQKPAGREARKKEARQFDRADNVFSVVVVVRALPFDKMSSCPRSARYRDQGMANAQTHLRFEAGLRHGIFGVQQRRGAGGRGEPARPENLVTMLMYRQPDEREDILDGAYHKQFVFFVPANVRGEPGRITGIRDWGGIPFARRATRS